MPTVRELAHELGTDVGSLLVQVQKTDSAVLGEDTPLDDELVLRIRDDFRRKADSAAASPADVELVNAANGPREEIPSYDADDRPSQTAEREVPNATFERSKQPAPADDATIGAGSSKDAGTNDQSTHGESVSGTVRAEWRRIPETTPTDEERGEFALAIGFSGSGKSSFLDIAARCADMTAGFDLQGSPPGQKTVFPVFGGRGALLDISGESFQRFIFRRIKQNPATYSAIARAFGAEGAEQQAISDEAFHSVERMIRDATTLVVIADGWKNNRVEQTRRIANDLIDHVGVSRGKRVVLVFTKCDLHDEKLAACYVAGQCDLRKPHLTHAPSADEIGVAFKHFVKCVHGYNVLKPIEDFRRWKCVELLYPPRRYVERFAAEQSSNQVASSARDAWMLLLAQVNSLELEREYVAADVAFVTLVKQQILPKVFHWGWKRLATNAGIGLVALASLWIVTFFRPSLAVSDTANLNNYAVQALNFDAGAWHAHPYGNLNNEATQAQLRKLMFAYESRKRNLRQLQIVDYRSGMISPAAQALASDSQGCSQLGLVNRFSNEIQAAISMLYENSGYPSLVASGQPSAAVNGTLTIGREAESCRAILAGFLRLRWEISRPNSDVSALAPQLRKAYANIRSIDRRLLTWYGFDDNAVREESLLELIPPAPSKVAATRFALLEAPTQPTGEQCGKIYSDGWIWIPSTTGDVIACEAELTELEWVKPDSAGGTGAKAVKTPYSVLNSWTADELTQFCNGSGKAQCRPPGKIWWWGWYVAWAFLVGSIAFFVASFALRRHILRRQLLAIVNETWANLRDVIRSS